MTNESRETHSMVSKGHKIERKQFIGDYLSTKLQLNFRVQCAQVTNNDCFQIQLNEMETFGIGSVSVSNCNLSISTKKLFREKSYSCRRFLLFIQF